MIDIEDYVLLMRDLVRETHVRKEDLIYPIFVVEQDDIKSEIHSPTWCISN